MAVKINISPTLATELEEAPVGRTIKIKIGETDLKENKKTVSLNLRKTLDGSILVYDHEELDIVVVPESRKIMALPKKVMGDHIYATQDRLFDFLRRNGVVRPDSIQGGNIYGVLEAQYPDTDKYDPVQVSLYYVSKFIDEERPYFETARQYEQEEIERLTDPTDQDSTELGEVPHEEEKGSIRPGWMRGPYGLSVMYRA